MEHGDIPIRLYRPSNGTEGMGFIAHWCGRCVKDREGREVDYAFGCKIVARTYAYNVTDPEYPTEWIVSDAMPPQCTAFVEDVGQKWPADATSIELEAAGQQRLVP